uniref:Putative glycosylphosphatidylinositol anchor synthesis protein n=1 Tax=Lutzomyia longipalpis TaxID=7200 RepID=A0A7G3ADG6_LUTLO
MSNLLARSFVKYDHWSISLGLFVCFLILTASLVLFLVNRNDDLCIGWTSYSIVFILIGTLCLKHLPKKFFNIESSLFSSGFMGNAIILTTIVITRINVEIIRIAVQERQTSLMPKMHKIPIFAIFCTVFHAISYSSSSFIEEEHQLWYYFGGSLFVLLLGCELRRFRNISVDLLISQGRRTRREDLKELEELNGVVLRYLALLAGHIFLRRLNQTGDKWLSIPDIGDWFVQEEHKTMLSWFFILTLLLMLGVCAQFTGVLTSVLTFTAILLIYYYRATTGQVYLFNISRSDSTVSLILFWVNLMEIVAINYLPILYRRFFLKKILQKDGNLWIGATITVFSLISCLLHKPHNAILSVACILTCQVVGKSLEAILSGAPKIYMLILSHLWIGKIFFFYQGNSNSLASIDLNAGYVGLSSFNMPIVGLFITINTFSGPLLALLVMLYRLQSDQSNRKHQSKTFLQTCSLFLILPLTLYMAIATGFRNHLFVWTVFSPKLLYEAFNFSLFHVILSLLGITWCH